MQKELEILSDRVDALTMMFCDLKESIYVESVENADRGLYKRWSQLETLCHQLVEENAVLFNLANPAKEV